MIKEPSKGAYIYRNEGGRREFRLVVGGAENALAPEKFILGEPYPNPFNNTVVIPFSVPQFGEVKVAVYNIKGQLVWERRCSLAPGWHELVWEGRDMSGRKVGSGIYIVRVAKEARKVAMVR